MVQAVFEVFPGATIETVRELPAPDLPANGAAGGDEPAADESADGEDVA